MCHTLFTWLTSTHFPKLILFRKPVQYSLIVTTVLLKAPKAKYLSQYQIYHAKLNVIVLYFYFYTLFFNLQMILLFLSLYSHSIVNGSYIIINHWMVGLNRKSYSHWQLPPTHLLETKLDRISVYHKGKENNFKSACTFWEPKTKCEFCIILSLIPFYLLKN